MSAATNRRRSSGATSSAAPKLEAEKLHGRINDLTSRVVRLEADQPHMNAALARVEKGVEEIKANLSKIVWMIILSVVGALMSLVLKGNLN